MMEGLRKWGITHVRLLSYVVGSLFITTWTLLRFFTERTIFDLVGQQVLAQQWLRGDFAGSGIGVTNYIVKIFAFYMPLHLLPGAPRFKLIALTVLVNIATLVLLGFVLEKLLRELGIKTSGAFYSVIVWLSVIAGSVFWIQFTNSRNLEVVGGVFLLYLGIRYSHQPTRRRLLGIALFCGILFFADTLQLYMTAVPLLLYCMLNRNGTKFRFVAQLCAAIIIGFLTSRLLFTACHHVLSVEFIQAAAIPFSLRTLPHGVANTAKALVHLYAGGADAGKVRELVNIGFFLGMLAALGYAVWRKVIAARILLLSALILGTNMVVYIVSGQAQHPGTERYLIMTAPAFMLLFGCLRQAWKHFWRLGLVAAGLLIIINVVFLGRAAIQGSRQDFAQDAHLASVERYQRNAHHTNTYASMDTALPMAYLYGSDQTAPLPLNCTAAGLRKTNTFYSQAAYRNHEHRSASQLAIILDSTAITNVPNVCSRANIEAQLGQPEATTTTDDKSIVLLYGPGVQSKLHY